MGITGRDDDQPDFSAVKPFDLVAHVEAINAAWSAFLVQAANVGAANADAKQQVALTLSGLEVAGKAMELIGTIVKSRPATPSGAPGDLGGLLSHLTEIQGLFGSVKALVPLLG